MTLQKLLEILQQGYPNQSFDAGNVRVYVMMLRDMPLELLTIAIYDLISTSKFLPTIAEIRSRVADLELDKAGIVQPMRAYELAVTADKSTWDEYPYILQAVTRSHGNLYDFRTSTNQASSRAKFLEAYNEIVGEKRKNIVMPDAVKTALAQPSALLLEEGD